jgi:hypothetical protein
MDNNADTRTFGIGGGQIHILLDHLLLVQCLGMLSGDYGQEGRKDQNGKTNRSGHRH